MLQHEKVHEVIAALGAKVFGVIVTHRGCTIELMHSGSEATSYWLATAHADDGADGIDVEVRAPDMMDALNKCSEAVEAVEMAGRQELDPSLPDEDPAMY